VVDITETGPDRGWARPTPSENPYACWTTQQLVDYLVDVGGRPVGAYIEYGRRRERGDIRDVAVGDERSDGRDAPDVGSSAASVDGR
jgi:hypothetical protein